MTYPPSKHSFYPRPLRFSCRDTRRASHDARAPPRRCNSIPCAMDEKTGDPPLPFSMSVEMTDGPKRASCLKIASIDRMMSVTLSPSTPLDTSNNRGRNLATAAAVESSVIGSLQRITSLGMRRAIRSYRMWAMRRESEEYNGSASSDPRKQ